MSDLKEQMLKIIQEEEFLRKMISALASGSFADQMRAYKEFIDTKIGNPKLYLELNSLRYKDGGYGSRATIIPRLNESIAGLIKKALMEKEIKYDEVEFIIALDEICGNLETLIKKK